MDVARKIASIPARYPAMPLAPIKPVTFSRKFTRQCCSALLSAVAVLMVNGSVFAQVSCGSYVPPAYPTGIHHYCLHTRYLEYMIKEGFFPKYPDATIGYTIFLPPQYATNPTQRFPVIYFLDGVGGGYDNSGWSAGSVGQLISDVVAAGKVTPFIYVWTEVGPAGMDGEWGANCPVSGDCDYDSTDSYVTKELIPFIDANYRTIASKNGRSIEGFSMGGSGCLRFAYKYPEMYSSVISYACSIYPGDYPRPGVMPTWPIPPSKADNISYCLYNQDKIRGKVAIWLRAGINDGGNLEDQWVHHRFLDSLNIPHKLDTVPDAEHRLDQLYASGNGSSGLNGLKFHAASWNLSSTSTQPEVNKIASRQSPGPKCVIGPTGFVSQRAQGSAAQRVFDIRGNLLSPNLTRTASRQAVGVRIVQGSGM